MKREILKAFAPRLFCALSRRDVSQTVRRAAGKRMTWFSRAPPERLCNVNWKDVVGRLDKCPGCMLLVASFEVKNRKTRAREREWPDNGDGDGRFT
jgi:hypothetical protein